MIGKISRYNKKIKTKKLERYIQELFEGFLIGISLSATAFSFVILIVFVKSIYSNIDIEMFYIMFTIVFSIFLNNIYPNIIKKYKRIVGVRKLSGLHIFSIVFIIIVFMLQLLRNEEFIYFVPIYYILILLVFFDEAI